MSNVNKHEEALALSLDAMQLDSPSQMTLSDLPEDILRLIMTSLSHVITLDGRDKYGWGRGGMNAVRLTCKWLMRVVESCVTRLSDLSSSACSLLFKDTMRCQRIELIRCGSWDLESVEGCPVRLKKLILNGRSLQNLEPLRACTELELLEIFDTPLRFSDLSPLASCAKMRVISVSI
jgi:hypothetical protein